MTRPTSVTVFGVLNVLFGILGLVGVLFSLVILPNLEVRVGDPMARLVSGNAIYAAWLTIGTALGAVATVALLLAGIGLLAGKSWGRLVSVYYGAYGVVMAVVGFGFNAVFLFPVMIETIRQVEGPEAAGAVGGLIGGVVGSVVGVIYPLLLLYFMTRQRVVTFFAGGPAMVDVVDGGFAMSVAAVASDNPYQSPGMPLGSGGSEGLDETVAAIIPYRNGPALVAYYLGLFSLLACIPFVGVFGVGMAVTAFVCGLKGLRRAAEVPEARGRVHAWIGIIGGALCGIIGTVVQALLVFALLAGAARR